MLEPTKNNTLTAMNIYSFKIWDFMSFGKYPPPFRDQEPSSKPRESTGFLVPAPPSASCRGFKLRCRTRGRGGRGEGSASAGGRLERDTPPPVAGGGGVPPAFRATINVS